MLLLLSLRKGFIHTTFTLTQPVSIDSIPSGSPGQLGNLVDVSRLYIQAKAPGFYPRSGVVLGSGLGQLAEQLERPTILPYAELPHFPRPSVTGHVGNLVLGYLQGEPLAVLQGRAHLYEGNEPWKVAFPVRVLASMGIKHLVTTNAAGGVNTSFRTGDLMLISDHLNFFGGNPLFGPNDDRMGPRFPDLSAAYHPASNQRLMGIAKAQGIDLKQGIYAMLSGPSYETPAEIRALRALGADAVGMSTVPEVIAAAHMGVRVTAISCITNLAAGMGTQTLSHDEVKRVASQAARVVAALLKAFLPSLHQATDAAADH